MLAALPAIELQELRPLLTPVRLVSGQVLIDAGQVIEHVYFIEDGLAAILAMSAELRPAVQVAMIGREGAVGCQALLDCNTRALVTCVTQIPGLAFRIRSTDLGHLLLRCPALSASCMAAIDRLIYQAMQAAASNACDTLTERCIRWLLMAHDRVDGDELLITQEALSSALGVRRSSITLVASTLQDAGLVRLNRGKITVVDRIGLEFRGRRSSQKASRDMPAPEEAGIALFSDLDGLRGRSAADGRAMAKP